MIGQINSGAALPFFTDPKYQTRYYSDDGHMIIASSIYLIPFMFWVDEAPDTVEKFYLVNVMNGAVTELDETKIGRRRLSDDSKAWYYFTGEDLETNIECGIYYIVVELGDGTKYYSDLINVQTFGVAETCTTVVNSVDVGLIELKSTHVLNTNISSAKVYYQVNGIGSWTELSTVVAGSQVTWEMPVPIPNLGAWYKIRYLYKTGLRNWVERFISLKFDNGDPGNTYKINVIDDNFIAHRELFEITIDNTTDYNNYLYSISGVTQKLYLPGSFGFPEVQRQNEFEENGDGETSLVLAKTRVKQTLTLLYIPDQFLQILSDINAYDNVTIIDLNNGKEYEAIETEFTPATQEDGYYSRGVLRFQSDYIQRGACGENVGAVTV